ncbi:hypothetical protein ATHL_01565 [Anaerolinea thermolimosa]|uniref:hypothetical protein n=1 Tax=Anaerolinea thermolimosa TaxID=229919 RepID=UPI00078247E7|nr:hypothetical protein [Anaerolinea thermolimosa]GAP06708.1 hypothetical protein ATHL_01565 [Anaerolinea thermolimosa]
MKMINRLQISRGLILIVLFLNLQCAIQFIFFPERYVYGFELVDEPGSIAVQGIGILFMMWNIPYIFAAFDPSKNFISLLEAVIMQGIGLAGETALYYSLTGEHASLRITATRFIFFDAGGLLALLVALLIVKNSLRER